ncbi:protein-lysine N-methyltransferase EEF2KMT isoform X2 [Myzus persicae]|uniref:protein-lysine N-methyltransferase EEF2KMT isoform X2 n=1 Tax=Myzus persicae TaxID=13164 RepID=UPI000B931DCC|nr:protein-lysine N-methyltransferase EEF2KMT isoform X2 [Myzus persicae]
MDITMVDCLNSNMVRQFMCATQLAAINFKNILKEVNFILMILSHPMLQKYPLKTLYISRFLKAIISQMENSGDELCDELYLKYVQLIQNESNEGPFYKHYILDNNISNKLTESVITIQESTSIVSQGTTGLCTWQAGIALSCWCLKNQDILKGKFILELGCGTGLSGISACINCSPSEYWFTDCHSAVLNTLQHNIQINATHHKFNCKFDVVKLSWNDIEDLKMFEEKKPDLVLAADVIFDDTMFEPLCSSLRYFTTNNTTEIILFCTLRNSETYIKFLATLKKYDLQFTQSVLPENYSIVLQQDCPIYIINVKQNAVMSK